MSTMKSWRGSAAALSVVDDDEILRVVNEQARILETGWFCAVLAADLATAGDFETVQTSTASGLAPEPTRTTVALLVAATKRVSRTTVHARPSTVRTPARVRLTRVGAAATTATPASR